MSAKHRRTKAASTSADQRPPEPSWRQPPPTPRKKMKMRKNATVAPQYMEVAGQALTMKMPAFRLQVERRHWIVLGVVLVICVGITVLFTDSRFFVYDATIRGNRRVPDEAIYTASDVDSKSVFWIQPDAVARRIEAVPGIAGATIRVRLPNRIVLEVEEYVPSVVWDRAGTQIWLAEDGSEVPAVGQIPALTLMDSGGAAADSEGKARPRVMVALQELHELRPDLTTIHYGGQEGLYFRAPEGWTVYLGNDGSIATKLALLEAVADQIRGEETPVTEVDLRSEGHAYYR